MSRALLAVLAEAVLRPNMPEHVPSGAAPYDVVMHGLTIQCGALGVDSAVLPELTTATFRARAHAFLRGSQ